MIRKKMSFPPCTLSDGAIYKVFFKFISTVLQVWIFSLDF